MNFQRLIHEKELLTIIGVSRSTIERWVKAGNFPSARELTQHRKAWWGEDVQNWIESRPRVRPELSQEDSMLNEVFKK
ncbi:TPA: AlpA family phage regulatory protein [Vibrio vulnificus]|uniref:helix-turn-helix transcriptional regulator n=1 Tax=Vibrio vulnificus TaxID=672 RepID=UPI0019D4B672|nr:AlpA family phage regulatory protein [Vibrio vulnificus]HAS6252244.1 AlpA family phage regulatory protein [Vibrio vulnificus]HAS6253941.1 AlpA family phage regulatory protein [Vibrio vulnificus]HDY7863066.1 AlpA family phage regulatory protein [Vibrio vulnificus]HDY7864868.1 AlpA family phage regulatory protein [Vibrio vulnificus]